MRVCSTHGCGAIYSGTDSRCAKHKAAADKRRGTAKERGYTGAGHRAFRAAVLERDGWCQLCGLVEATVADHHPLSRRELVEQGLDPNDPQYGRGLCKPDHDRETAAHQPGGWAAR